MLDREVISAPSVSERITGGKASISGTGITESTAKALATTLRYGSLPVDLETSSVDTVSPVLGGNQMTAGIIAGIVGLALVIAYSLLYYRGLTIVVAGSLLAAAAVTYAVMVLLGSAVGFALNLPGIAGAIVAIGVTADSFVVYFERIRDEIRDGHSLHHSIQSGWHKARGTILMADGVQLLAAVVLYFLAIGSVKGFAFTLGVTTAIDLLLVIFFTHPLMTLLGRTTFFGEGHKNSGLIPSTWASAGPPCWDGVAPPANAPSPTRLLPASPARARKPRRPAMSDTKLAPSAPKTTFAHRLYTGDFQFDFMAHRRRWYTISAVLLLISVLAVSVRG